MPGGAIANISWRKEMCDSTRFWEATPLQEMTATQWESLCDGCGKCCLHKVEDEDSGDIFVCNVACKLLDLDSCRCSDYERRKKLVPDCTVLTIDSLDDFKWLPKTCAYRLVYEGKPLESWHPLISGNSESVHEAGFSVRGRVVSEDQADDLDWHITDWQL